MTWWKVTSNESQSKFDSFLENAHQIYFSSLFRTSQEYYTWFWSISRSTIFISRRIIKIIESSFVSVYSPFSLAWLKKHCWSEWKTHFECLKTTVLPLLAFKLTIKKTKCFNKHICLCKISLLSAKERTTKCVRKASVIKTSII